jgi:post-segregation antitoxin (ccd killing protein)
MAETRITTIRQSAEQADEVEFAARVEGIPVSEFIREAIAAHLEARRSDPGFQERLRERMKADQHILRRLAE